MAKIKQVFLRLFNSKALVSSVGQKSGVHHTDGTQNAQQLRGQKNRVIEQKKKSRVNLGMHGIQTRDLRNVRLTCTPTLTQLNDLAD